MSKVLPYVVMLILIIVGLAVFLKYHVGEIPDEQLSPSQSALIAQRAILDTKTPSAATSTQLGYVPEKVSLPLQVEEGYSIGLVGKVSGARDLAISDQGVVVVSSPSQGEVVGFLAENGVLTKKTILKGLSAPHGLAFYQNKLFVAEDKRLSRYSWDDKTLKAEFEKELMKLPTGGHAAHTLVFDKSGQLFVKIGSSCNVCSESDANRAIVLKTDSEGNNPQVFARGLRNAAFMTLNQNSGDVWVTENGRDSLGDDLPPDEINILKSSSDYGWPYCFGNQVHDGAFDSKNEFKCSNTTPAFYDLPAHTAPLGLGFLDADHLLVALHGSWNSSTLVGYKIVQLTLENGQVNRMDDFLSGFLDGTNVLGRPVDIEVDKKGNIFVSDDKSGSVYVVTKK